MLPIPPEVPHVQKRCRRTRRARHAVGTARRSRASFGETRESARPLSEEGVPGRQRRVVSPPPDSTVGALAAMPDPGAASAWWVIGSGARLDDAATALGASATMVMTGAARVELRGEYTRRNPDGLDGIDGVAGSSSSFSPRTGSLRSYPWRAPPTADGSSTSGARGP